MSLSRLPIGYCTNVHPGQSVAAVVGGLERYTARVRERLGHDLAAGLWLARPVVDELLKSNELARFSERLRTLGLTCYTLNAFPFGNFHAQRVKENVYLPDWASRQRLAYTLDCAKVLSELLSIQDEGSISTLPLGFKAFEHPAGFLGMAMDQLIEAALGLARIHSETGRMIRLAIEPEPLCMLETTAEAIGFFQGLWHRAETRGALEIAQRHLGLCYDVCHQAVEFEDVAASIRMLDESGIRINKVHISCAPQLDRPAEYAVGRDALRSYIEPRYLHQIIAQTADGRLLRAIDLDEQLITNAPAEFMSATRWRIHFHVPVDAERLGPLITTRPALREALRAVAALPYAPHLEVETYTWEVLPSAGPLDLVEGLTRELISTETLLDELRREKAQA